MKTFNNIIVEKIYAAKEGKNQDYSTLQLRATGVSENTNATNLFLGSKAQRVAFQTIKNENIDLYHIVEGCNLNEVMGLTDTPNELRLKVTEILEDELSGNELGFIIKTAGKGGQNITKNGTNVWRKVEVDSIDSIDTLVLDTDKVLKSEEVAEAKVVSAFGK